MAQRGSREIKLQLFSDFTGSTGTKTQKKHLTSCQIQNNMLQSRKSKEEKSRLLDMSQRACVGASRYRRNGWTWSRSCVPKRYRLGYDGFTRYRDRLSMNHFSSVVDKACVVRHKWIWGGNTKHMLSSLKYFREEGFFICFRRRWHHLRNYRNPLLSLQI